MAGISKETGKPIELPEHIRQSIYTILTTPLGSRVMRPAVGFDALNEDGSPKTGLTADAVRLSAIAALGRWEPRINVLDARPNFSPDGSLTSIQVFYADKQGGEQQQVSIVYSPQQIPLSASTRIGSSARGGLSAAVLSTVGETAPVLPPELPPGTTRVVADSGGPISTDASVSSAASAPIAGTAPQPVPQMHKGAAVNPSAPANSFSETPAPEVASGAHVSLEAPPAAVATAHAPTIQIDETRNSVDAARRGDIAAITRASTVIGRAVLQNGELIELAGVSFLLLVEDRLETLRQARLNTEEAQAAIEGYEDLKRKVEEFLAQATQFKAGQTNEQELVSTKTSFADALSNWWTKRHVEALDVGLFGVALIMCQLADPLSVLVSGVLVGGKSVVETFKAAAKICHSGDDS
jgi:phage baseplate assembly protein W